MEHLLSHLPPEQRIVLSCARTRQSEKDIEILQSLLKESPDWEKIIAFAGRHGIFPHLYRTLTTYCEDNLNPDTLEKLEKLFHEIRINSLRMSQKLMNIITRLKESGIAAVPFKGPVLASYAYDSITLRDFEDLDMLIRKEDIHPARQALEQLGYIECRELTGEEETAQLEYGSELHLSNTEESVEIDMHQELLDKLTSPGFDNEGVWRRITTVSFLGAEVPTLSLEDTILYLLIHGGKHLWERIGWLSDIEAIVANADKVDWNWIEKEADKTGNRRFFLVGTYLLEKLVGVNAGAELRTKWSKDQKVGEICLYLLERLFSDETMPQNSIIVIPYLLRMKDDFIGRLRFYLRFITTLNPLDYQFIKLPRPLRFLYYLVRPVRFFCKHILKKTGGSSDV